MQHGWGCHNETWKCREFPSFLENGHLYFPYHQLTTLCLVAPTVCHDWNVMSECHLKGGRDDTVYLGSDDVVCAYVCVTDVV